MVSHVLQYKAGTGLITAPTIAGATVGSYFTIDLTGVSASSFGIYFKSDGSRFYTAHDGPQYEFAQYDMSPAWDISSNSRGSITYVGSANIIFDNAFAWNDDGTKFYVLRGEDVRRYNTSTAWSFAGMDATVDYTLDAAALVAGVTNFSGAITFKPDGTKMYLTENATEKVYQFSLGTAWDLSTASYDSKTLDASSQTVNDISAILFDSTGVKLFVLSHDQSLYEYDLSTAWDISTGTYNSVTIADTNPTYASNTVGMAFNADETKLYVVNVGTENEIIEWNLA